MMTFRRPFALVSVLLLLSACTPVPQKPDESAAMKREAPASSKAAAAAASAAASVTIKASAVIWNEAEVLKNLPKTEAEWKAKLTSGQYAVLRQSGTERPFTSDLLDEHRKGTYVTADCGQPVFRSEQKYDSGTGWPSFWAPISADALVEVTDESDGLVRTEIRSKCGGHLGHVFDDGPQPTGLRYCMNGLALRFIPDEVQ